MLLLQAKFTAGFFVNYISTKARLVFKTEVLNLRQYR